MLLYMVSASAAPELDVTCPHCGFQASGLRHGQFTVVNRIVKVLGTEVHIVCDRCRRDVHVPWMTVMVAAVQRAPL